MIAAFARYRRLDEAWIVFVADHGEELGRVVEHRDGRKVPYFGHSRFLYDSSVRVPLIIRPPKSVALRARRERRVVSTESLAATFLDIAGLEASESMAPALPLDPAADYPAAVFSVARDTSQGPVPSNDPVTSSIRTDSHRLIRYYRPAAPDELVTYESSGGARAAEEQAARLGELLEAWESYEFQNEAVDREISERERRLLESLGYLSSDDD